MGKATRPQVVKRIRELYSYDYSMVDIAKSLGISARTVSNIVHGRTRQGVPAGVEIPDLPVPRGEVIKSLRERLAQQPEGPQRPRGRGRSR